MCDICFWQAHKVQLEKKYKLWEKWAKNFEKIKVAKNILQDMKTDLSGNWRNLYQTIKYYFKKFIRLSEL